MSKDKAKKFLNLRPRWYHNIPASLYFLPKSIGQSLRLLKKLRRGKEIRRHFGISTEIYEAYSDWEMRAYENGSRWTVNGDRMAVVSFREIRAHYLETVIAEAKKMEVSLGRPIRILEVGCGNGTNLMILKSKLSDETVLFGIDVAKERIRLGVEYWGSKLDGVEFRVDSATTLSTFEDETVDLAFSVHCLEQLPYSVDAVLQSIHRVVSHAAVFVEPVWEYANTSQRMYTLFGDQLRTLVPSIGSLDFEIIEQRKARLLANPMNQTGIIVVNKAKKQL